jgi:riboflavin kinase/FMN adenylyltransferase
MTNQIPMLMEFLPSLGQSLLRDGPRSAGICEKALWSIRGEVLHGAKFGRTIGFPTANLIVKSEPRPEYGIYASRVRLADGRCLPAATNFGVRPTFSPPEELLESFIFDFDEDLYGQLIEVELVEFLRPERKFATIDALSAQMKLDCEIARGILTTQA